MVRTRTLCPERDRNPIPIFSKKDLLEDTELGPRIEGTVKESGSSGASGTRPGDRRQPGALCHRSVLLASTRPHSPAADRTFPWEGKQLPTVRDPYVFLSTSTRTNPRRTLMGLQQVATLSQSL